MFEFKPAEAKGPVRVLKGGLLIDGNGGKPVKDPVILLEGRRIKQVGTKGKVKIPAKAEVIDCGSATLLPGLMDVHLHTMMFNCLTFHNYRVAQWEITPELQQMYGLFHAQLCFDMGFTTLRDLGLNSGRGLLTAHLCAIRDSINAGVIEGPRMLIGGFTTITGSHLDLIQPRAAQRYGFQTADGPWELRKLARTNLLAGCDIVKTCATGGGGTDKEEPDIRNMTQEEINAIVDEAHAFHKIAAVHCFTPNGQRMALEAGADTFAGAIPLILKINSSNSLISIKDQSVTASIKDALRLGCSAIGFTIYPGSEQMLEMQEEIVALSREAKEHGIATVIWSYIRGPKISKEGELAVDNIAYGAHMAALLGAHIIKVKLPSDHLDLPEAKKVYEDKKIPVSTQAERVRHVMKSSFNGKRIVVFSGGATKDEGSVYDDARAIYEGGGNGSIIGRNSFQRPRDEALAMLDKIMNIYLGKDL